MNTMKPKHIAACMFAADKFCDTHTHVTSAAAKRDLYLAFQAAIKEATKWISDQRDEALRLVEYKERELINLRFCYDELERESRAAHARTAPDIITGEPIEFVQEAAQASEDEQEGNPQEYGDSN